MFFKRWIGIALVALLAIGVISGISGAAQRDAWMQGYMAGRLSTGSDGGAAIAPYLMGNGGFGPHYGWWGGGFGLFIGLGFLAFALFLISRRLHWQGPHDGSQGGAEDWHERMRAEAQRWHERHHRRWEDRGQDRGPGDEQRMV